MTPEKKVAWVETTLSRMERGLWTGVTIGQVTDTIAWLWKFRKISYDKMTDLTAKARYVISTCKPD